MAEIRYKNRVTPLEGPHRMERTMSDTTTPRWSEAVTTSTTFTMEQKQRVHAVRCAREVLETRSRGSIGSVGGTAITGDTGGLLAVAEWIVTGRSLLAGPGVLKMPGELPEMFGASVNTNE